MAAMVGGFSEPKDIAFSAETGKEELKDPSNALSEPAHLPPQGVHPKDPKEQQEEDHDDDKEEDDPKVKPGSDLKDHDDESEEGEVKVLSLSIVSPGRADHVLPLPFVPNSKGTLFTLKEGSRFRLKFCFSVCNNVVSGFTYTNTVWRAGIRVDSRKVILGTYSPRQDPYSCEFEEETIPTGMFARGSYSARTKFVDGDGNCYLDARYRFEIQKNWGTASC